MPAPKNKRPSGGSNDYYQLGVPAPTRPGIEPYICECNDIIEGLELNFAEGNILKALWRIARARQGKGKPNTPREYDAEKVLFFAKRVLVQNGGEEE